jgi:hypothetical protein
MLCSALWLIIVLNSTFTSELIIFSTIHFPVLSIAIAMVCQFIQHLYCSNWILTCIIQTFIFTKWYAIALSPDFL